MQNTFVLVQKTYSRQNIPTQLPILFFKLLFMALEILLILNLTGTILSQ